MSTDIDLKPTVEQLPNGQYMVKSGKLTLIHTDFKGFKFNECTEDKTDCVEMCNPHDPKFKPLFIALHNFKSYE